MNYKVKILFNNKGDLKWPFLRKAQVVICQSGPFFLKKRKDGITTTLRVFPNNSNMFTNLIIKNMSL